MKEKIILGFVILLAAIGFFFGKDFIRGNTNNAEKTFIYIKTGSDYNALLTALKPIIKDLNSFEKVANKMNLKNKVHPGKYQVTTNMSNYNLVKMLRSSNQKPVKLVVKKYRFKNDLVRKICSSLETDSTQMFALLNDNVYLQQFGLDSNTSIAAFMPNTYEYYWNSDAKKVFEKVAKNYTKFWNEERKNKAKNINLSPSQVMTLASIVEEETNKNSDKGNIASVYLNRLRLGMKLQADPTSKYAYGDFSIKRILNKHIEFPSIWNTYYVMGLPPGPICTPQESSIEAVLNAPKTNYIFFCADENLKGGSNFAATLAEHEVNAKKFQQAMNARGIRK